MRMRDHVRAASLPALMPENNLGLWLAHIPGNQLIHFHGLPIAFCVALHFPVGTILSITFDAEPEIEI